MRMILLMYIPLIPLTPSPAGLLHTKNSFSRKKIACCEPCELDYLEYFNQEKLIFTKNITKLVLQYQTIFLLP